MTGWLQAHALDLFHKYGYWTVFWGLLLENAGLPVPGETVLILATLLATSQHENVFVIGLVAIAAAVIGDNIGFTVGHFGGPPLLKHYSRTFRISDDLIRKGEGLFARHGKLTVFFARFITGMRVIAGPLAGVLRMHWLDFTIFNALGAICWVTVIVTAAYLIGPAVERLISRFSWFVLVFVVAAAAWWWWRRRKNQRSATRSEALRSD